MVRQLLLIYFSAVSTVEPPWKCPWTEFILNYSQANFCSRRCEQIHQNRACNSLKRRESAVSSLLSCPFSTYQFLFLSGFHHFLFYLSSSLCLSGLPFIMPPYLTMSSDTCPLLSASVYFHPLCLPTFPFFLSSSLYPGLSGPFLPLRSNFSPSLCDIARFARAHTRAHTHFPDHTYAQSQSGIPWMRLTGLFELCGTALRDCV